MVVLARLSGIPARLAVGYATGDYDERAGEYVVTELQAHSWPELYFPGYGWIPFEPTPARLYPPRTELARVSPPLAEAMPADMEAGMAELRGLATAQAVTRRRWSMVMGFLGVLNGLLACWLVSRTVRQLSPASILAAPGEAGRGLRPVNALGRPAGASRPAGRDAAGVCGGVGRPRRRTSPAAPVGPGAGPGRQPGSWRPMRLRWSSSMKSPLTDPMSAARPPLPLSAPSGGCAVGCLEASAVGEYRCETGCQVDSVHPHGLSCALGLALYEAVAS